MKNAPEYYRVKTGPMPSDASFGNNGAFEFPHYKIHNYYIFCICSDGMGWEHVSVTILPKGKDATRCPTWEEMCWVKDQFWNKDECVVQYHPAESEYASCHHFCLHLWKPTSEKLPTPDSIMVGPKTTGKVISK
jgi:hypothetical protein